MNSCQQRLPFFLRWSLSGRLLVGTLAAASIWCLLAEFYGICSMRFFTIWILLPATALLIAIAVLDHLRGERILSRAVIIGSIAGLLAAVAYDIFRLPFVYSTTWGLGKVVPQMDLFKVFPRFGAMILGQPIDQSHYTLAAYLIGWIYHFSNGLTFGIMYIAIIGDTRHRSWLWAVLLAAGIELAMLGTPYTQFFSIAQSTRFVAVTMAAHIIFGTALGLSARRLDEEIRPELAFVAERLRNS